MSISLSFQNNSVVKGVGGRPSEKRYQLAAQKRNQTAQRFDYYNQTANYFERECRKAKKFNSWSCEKLKPSYWDNLKKTEALHRRQSQLQELLKSEEELYNREIQQLKQKKPVKEELTLEALRQKLKEKRTENSLYHPHTFRRIKSYFTYPTKSDRAILRELNNPVHRKLTKMSLENTNLRNDDQQSETEHNHSYQSNKNKVIDYTNLEDQEAHSIREQEYRNNRSASQKSNFGDYTSTECYAKKPEKVTPEHSCGAGCEEPHDRSASSHQNQFQYEVSGDYNMPRKFEQRYAQRSLQDTNVRDTAGHTVDAVDDSEKVQAENVTEDTEEEMVDKMDALRVKIGEKGEGQHREDEAEEIRQDRENEIFQDKLLIYLTYKELKKKIEDLERREIAATNRQSWEDALRLKDSKNRIELFRDKTFYERADLNMNAELKEMAMKSIKERSKLIDLREKFCINEQMYSEEAKKIYNNWADEDRRTVIKDEKAEREFLLRQLEDEWEMLEDREKQKMYSNYENMMKRSYLQHEMELLDKLSNH